MNKKEKFFGYWIDIKKMNVGNNFIVAIQYTNGRKWRGMINVMKGKICQQKEIDFGHSKYKEKTGMWETVFWWQNNKSIIIGFTEMEVMIYVMDL